jgi:toxin ParE1/3/4
MQILIISPEAEQDLIDIWLYIAEDQPVNADRFLEQLQEKAQKLAEFTD